MQTEGIILSDHIGRLDAHSCKGSILHNISSLKRSFKTLRISLADARSPAILASIQAKLPAETLIVVSMFAMSTQHYMFLLYHQDWPLVPEGEKPLALEGTP